MPIVLDLETTGFEADKDQIIEIAAIKFDGEKIIDTFETFINPEIPIPEIITHITGIRAEDLTDAPKFHEISEKLREFLGDEIIVGHNIGFDVTFLQQKGLPLRNKLYDTLPLASILLPGLPSYSLDTLSRIFKITHLQKHRANSDAHANFELFLLLQRKLENIDFETLMEIRSVLSRSSWDLKELFLKAPGYLANVDFTEEATSTKESQTGESTRYSEPPETFLDFNKIAASSLEDLLENIYSEQLEKGFFKKIIDNYEFRPNQKELSLKILKAFQEKHHLLIEASIGTGKNLAALTSAILFAITNNQKVALAIDNKKNEEDFSQKIAYLKKFIPDFQIATLKLPKNYLSLLRLENFKKKNSFNTEETTFLLKVLLWVKETKTGDFNELNLQGKEFSFLDEICCTEYSCDHRTDADCYFYKAYHQAENCHLLILQHKFLLQNETLTKILSEFNYFIFLDAHELEKNIDAVYQKNLSLHWFQKPFEKLLELLEEVNKKYSSSKDKTQQFVFETTKSLEHLLSKIDLFFGLLGIFTEKNIHPSNPQYNLMISASLQDDFEWQKVASAATTLLSLGSEVLTNLQSFSQKFSTFTPQNKKSNELQLTLNFEETVEDKESEESFKKILLGELQNRLHECETRLNDLRSFFEEKTEKNIQWIYKGFEGSINLRSALINPGDIMETFFFGQKHCLIFLSEHLTVKGNFDYVRNQLKIPAHVEEIILNPHFKHPETIKIVVPKNFPSPSANGFFNSCCDIIKSTILKNKGRTMVIFPSKKALTASYKEIAASLKEEGISVLAHKITGGKGKIMEHFKDEPDSSAIFALPSFWEEIETTEFICLILQKICFDPPDDPIISIRSQKYQDSFKEYFLPRAILHLKKTFYRLIGQSDRKGTLFVLDTRLIQNDYGSAFFQSLPPEIKVEVKDVKEL